MSVQREIRHGVRSGITHFDLANNYGPPYGSAETNFGRILREDWPYRDEVVISSKAGWDVGRSVRPGRGRAQVPGREPRPEPARVGVDYFDIFY